MLVTLDPYYNVDFYNQSIEALKNNNVDYRLYVQTISPYNFYIDVPSQPLFVNYDLINQSNSRHLAAVTIPNSTDGTYLFLRRMTHTGKKGFNYYAFNDVFKAMKKSKEGIIFDCSVDSAKYLSRYFPRKIYYLGKYMNKRYTVMACDSLIVKNYFDKVSQKITVLAESNNFTTATELETEVNHRIFSLKDRLMKVSNTPFIQNGDLNRFYINGQLSTKFGI